MLMVFSGFASPWTIRRIFSVVSLLKQARRILNRLSQGYAQPKQVYHQSEKPHLQILLWLLQSHMHGSETALPPFFCL